MSRQDADIFVPDGAPMPDALRRTTHVCVGAHQDDQEFMAFHGIAECFGRKDRGFAGVVVTNGAGSSRTGIYADYTDEDMMRVRVQEQRKAAVIGEYACQIQLMHPSADVKKPGHPGVLADLAADPRDRRGPRWSTSTTPPTSTTRTWPCCLRTIAAIRSLPTEQRAEAGARLRDLARPRLAERRRQAGPARRPRSRTSPPRSPASSTPRSPAASATTSRWPVGAPPTRRFFESHATDKADALSFAMDLTPLVEDDTLDVLDYTLGFLRRFENEVRDRFARLG